jgi:hypothetical protein
MMLALLTHEADWHEHVPPAPGWPYLGWSAVLADPSQWTAREREKAEADGFDFSRRVGFVLSERGRKERKAMDGRR